MNFQFTNPWFLLLLPPALAWVIWLSWKSDVQTGAWRRWTAFAVRTVVVVALVLAMAGLQWLRPLEGMNVFFLLDRSESVPAAQQEWARALVNDFSKQKKPADRAGVVVFGTEAAIEFSPNPAVDFRKFQAVVETERSDLAAALRLGTAAFPETGQKRLVLFSDGNENRGDAMAAVLAARPLGVTVDVAPLGVSRGSDVSVQKLSVPSGVKKGQTFEAKIFALADRAQQGTVRLYRNQQFLGEQVVDLAAGKNLFTFPQTLDEAGFYSYDVHLDVVDDPLPQNNRATSYTHVRGDPRVLILSADPEADAPLAAALQTTKLEVRLSGVIGMPETLAEMQSYDTIFLSNIAAGDLGNDLMQLVESAVRDFGVGLVCVGGDQAFAAGSYRGTPLESVLPVDMELSSKKVIPSGAVVLIMHGMEFMNGNEIARECALGLLDALGPQDELGVVLWDGMDKWLFPLGKAGDKREMGRKIAGMNQGDLPSFQNVMQMSHAGLKESSANLKHIIVFSDGDPAAPSEELMKAIVGDRITVTTVLIAGHAGPQTMIWIAEKGNGRFYDVQNPGQLPQIFVKEAAVVLKSAIIEEPFRPQVVSASEALRGIGSGDYPVLRGYVATTPKSRAEMPLLTEKGDPLLAHWQYGLGRAVAFTSDAKAKWAADWMGWEKFQQFWSQVARWSLRRIENAEFTTEVSVDRGEGMVSVEAIDAEGNYRNFLNLQTIVVSPKGERQTVRLEQTGPGRYEAKFATREVGAYLLNLLELQDGRLRGSQVLGASVNYSPEFSEPGPNLSLLARLAEAGRGKVLEAPADNPFLHGRQKTFQPQDLWEWLLKFAIILFLLDVGIRRIQLDREEWLRATATLRRWLFFWRPVKGQVKTDESLAALLARRDAVRSGRPASVAQPDPGLFQPGKPVVLPAKDRPAEKLEPAAVASSAEAKPVAAAEPESTTSRLLEAKRKARKKLE